MPGPWFLWHHLITSHLPSPLLGPSNTGLLALFFNSAGTLPPLSLCNGCSLFLKYYSPHIYSLISFFYQLLSKNYPGYPILNSNSHTFISQCGIPLTLLSLFYPLALTTSNRLYNLFIFLICLLVEYKLGMFKNLCLNCLLDYLLLLFDP